MLLKLTFTIFLILCIKQVSLTVANQQTEKQISDEPFLRDLFEETNSDQLTKLTSCLDSVFKLNQAYEALFSLKAIYNDYLSNKTENLTDFEQKLLRFCGEPLPVKNAADKFWHPVSAHKFVVFAVREMNPKLHQLIKQDSRVKILLRHLLESAECWLNEDSIAESIRNLLVIKSFYNISVADFADGIFADRKSENGFSTSELMDVLLHLNRQFDPLQTVEFGEYLRQERMPLVKSELGEQPARSVYRILGKVYYQMKQFDKAMEALNEYKQSVAAPDTDLRGVDADLAYIAENRRGDPADFALEARQSGSGLEREFGIASSSVTAATPTKSASVKEEAREKFQRYRHLCHPQRRGLIEPDDAEMAARAANLSANPLLVCETWRPYNGWYPIRKEILSIAPLIVRYSNVFTNASLVRSLIVEAEKRIFEAPKDKDMIENRLNKLTQVRVHSFQNPMPAFDSNVSQAIIDRVEFVTRLDASRHFVSNEKFIEVFNYGHGIRNNPHLATQLPEVVYNGLAEAFIFPVENLVGGDLVYPDIDLKIPTKLSDLVIQYNYLPTYHVDRQGSRPLVCPILFGDKWVARIPLGLQTCSIDQELMMEPWLPGTTLARRRSVARSWKTLIRAEPLANSTAANATNKNVTDATNSTVTEQMIDVEKTGNATSEGKASLTQTEDLKLKNNTMETEAKESNEKVESTDSEEKDDAEDGEEENE